MKSNTLSWRDPFSLQKMVVCLGENGVILAPSDTVWGLCGIPTQTVFESLNRLKVRNEKPYLLLARSLEDIEKYGEVPQEEGFLKMMETLWPGPLTIIFKAREDAPHFMVSGEGTVAFRIPKHEQLQALLAQVGILFSTSANISGHPVPERYEDISSFIKEGVSLAVVPEKEEEVQSIIPSTIIDISHGKVTVVRAGAIPLEVLQVYRSE
jgi:L-threonylcarbamoyladenylate synthase